MKRRYKQNLLKTFYNVTNSFTLYFSSAYWVNISQKCINIINSSTVTVSRLVMVLYVTLKYVINGHNKNILHEQKKPSPCNFRDKTSCPLNWSCHHKNIVYSCKVPALDIKQNHPHYIGLKNMNLKIDSKNIIVLSSTS